MVISSPVIRGSVDKHRWATLGIYTFGAIAFGVGAFLAPTMLVASACAVVSSVMAVLSLLVNSSARKEAYFYHISTEAENEIYAGHLAQVVDEELYPQPPMMMAPPPEHKSPALPQVGTGNSPSEEQIWKKCECPPEHAGDKLKKQLWDWLAFHYPWVLMLLEVETVLVIGPQGSGKTTLMGYLAMLKKIFLGDRLIVLDPHAHDNSDRWIPGFFECHGANYNYEEIKEGIDQYFWRLKNAPRPIGITDVCDEVTTWNDRIEGGDKGFAKSILVDNRKSGEKVIAGSHSNTNSCWGGTPGVSALRKQNVTIYLVPQRLPGGKVIPAWRGTISGLEFDSKGEPVEMAISWSEEMNPQYLASLFPHLAESEMRERIVGNLEKPPELPETGGLTNSINRANQALHRALEDETDETGFALPEGWEGVNPLEPLSLENRGLLVEAVRYGWSQNKVITEFFGISKGNTPAYRKAREIYQETRELFGEF